MTREMKKLYNEGATAFSQALIHGELGDLEAAATFLDQAIEAATKMRGLIRGGVLEVDLDTRPASGGGA